jgi:hypothetical protein
MGNASPRPAGSRKKTSELVKKWGLAPSQGPRLPRIRHPARCLPPFFHKISGHVIGEKLPDGSGDFFFGSPILDAFHCPSSPGMQHVPRGPLLSVSPAAGIVVAEVTRLIVCQDFPDCAGRNPQPRPGYCNKRGMMVQSTLDSLVSGFRPPNADRRRPDSRPRCTFDPPSPSQKRT